MKKLVILMMICTLLVACGNPGDSYESYFDQSNLKGNIKSIRTEIYGMSYVDGSIAMTYNLDTHIVEEVSFKKNQRTEVILLDSDGEIIVNRTFKYNGKDQLEQIISSEVEAGGVKEARMAYYKSGNMKSMTTVNAKGQAIKTTSYKDEDTTNDAIIYEYNDQGDITLAIATLEDGVVSIETYTYVYDDENNWTEREVSRDGTVIFRTIRTITYK